MTRKQELTNEVLEEAARLLEEGWCQGHSMEDADGNPITEYFPHEDDVPAVAFCANAALEKATADCRAKHGLNGLESEGVYMCDLEDLVASRLPGAEPLNNASMQIIAWNDEECQSGSEAAALMRRTKHV